jgi:CubicO group peptidase (beta-lactamase class C family)
MVVRNGTYRFKFYLAIPNESFMRIYILLLFTFLCNCLYAQQNSTPKFITDSLGIYISQALADWEVPGAAVCIVKDGKVVLMNGYGVREKGTSEPVDANTLFMIGSNTKAFTATALAKLASQKKIRLSDKVQQWLPNFKLRDEWTSKNIMVKDLLCHRLGFETFQGDFTYWTSNLTRQQIMEKMALVRPLNAFRDGWGYCNAAFLTAGEIIPKVTGGSWEDFMRDSIFKPLGMTRTLALSAEMKNATNTAKPHTINHQFETVKLNFPAIDNLAPAGSIGSSVNDMSKWVMMLLNNGKYEGKTIVPANAIQITRTPHSILGKRGSFEYNKSHYSLYGLGWFLGEYQGREIVSHTGGVNGFVTAVTLVPEENLGIIVFTNTDMNNLYVALNNEILDAYLQLPFRNYSKQSLKNFKAGQAEEKAWVKKMKDSIESKQPVIIPVAQYAGKYQNELYGDITIELKNNHLKMYFQNHPNMTAELDWLGNHRFLCTYSDPTMGRKVIPFSVSNGKATGFTLTMADFVEFLPYEFTRKQ